MTDLEMNPPEGDQAQPSAVVRSYVAIGDSLTEGLDDPASDGRYRGFADRLAEHLSASAPGFRYANLAVRGRRMRHIFGEQLEQTLNFGPDLVTVHAGGNDVLRPNADLDGLAAEFEAGIRRLRDAGIRVVILSGHDTGWIPVLRVYRGRIAVFSMHLRAVAERTASDIVDLWSMGALNDPRAWSVDRLHFNAEGHRIVAARIADLLDAPMGPREIWVRPWESPPERLPRILRRRENWRWAREHLVPWLSRRALGRSSGDGRAPKRPQLTELSPDPEGAESNGSGPTAVESGGAEPASGGGGAGYRPPNGRARLGQARSREHRSGRG
ncbi:SGNH/GDSL hydrolase family protein [Streptomonospora wellingtoniae]|uniref:SGNH/GDSL hydrolase family protein n=1 Tax=Streptomonospora wellingtoniae TaxID=3075544 RepID=A0ABU2KW49_9ACTN|nr:SGNH/GDSL hydrolase family protein [Streptomonospora sp. DSM 45055]MDT0303520.1 SGNH/GDSL hydrolase family protein [Streptomonospora sp. DSM 45055]